MKGAANISYQDALLAFGSEDLDEAIIATIKQYLVECLTIDTRGATNFNQVRKKAVDLSKFPCTSMSLRNHIKRSYLQTKLLKCAATSCNHGLDETMYGYHRD